MTDGEAPALQALDVSDFLTLPVPKREMLLSPVLPAKGLIMVYAARGIGKTQVAVGIACAVATGTSFLRWSAPRKRRVLYIDGEMPAALLQERLTAALQKSGSPDPGYLRLLSADIQEFGIPDLVTPDGQRELDAWLEGVDLVILDNLSTLCRALIENEGDSWQPVQDWLLSLRRRGISVILVHHASRGGTARGTNRREDILDTVIALKRPDDYLATEGARFIVEVEKARGIFGSDVEGFEARLDVINGRAEWTMKSSEDRTTERVAAMLRDGATQRSVAKELDIGLATVNRHKTRALEKGLAVSPP